MKHKKQIKQLNTLADTKRAATELAVELGKTDVLYLHGQMAAGKTTFSRYLLNALGVTGTIKSPTYTIVEPYVARAMQLYHFDLYRIADAHELEAMGIREYFNSQSIAIIEWPENGLGVIAAPTIELHLNLNRTGRELKINFLRPS